MPQRDLLLPWRSALDNAGLALELRGEPRREARRRAAALFERFGLEEFTSARPDELSGGMRQRVAFARTLLADRPVLLLDEPFASLDAITRAELQEWTLAALAAEPRTVLLVTHDIEEALYVCNRVLVLTTRPGQVRAALPGAPAAGRRRDAVTSEEFSQLRHRALEALA
jgi:NitT/TauT family transport system ATP-binding protein